MAASAKLVLIGLLSTICLELVSSSRILKESSVHTESAESHSEDGSSSAWATVAGSGQASASGTGVGTQSVSGLDGIGVGIGVDGDSGLGAGFGTGVGTGIGVSIGLGGNSGLGTGTGVGIGQGTGSGTGVGIGQGTGSGAGIGIGIGGGGGTVTETTPRCNHPTQCTYPTSNPTIEIPVWIPGECSDDGTIYEPPVCVPSTGCQQSRCTPGHTTGSSHTRKFDKISESPHTKKTYKGYAPVIKLH